MFDYLCTHSFRDFYISFKSPFADRAFFISNKFVPLHQYTRNASKLCTLCGFFFITIFQIK